MTSERQQELARRVRISRRTSIPMLLDADEVEWLLQRVKALDEACERVKALGSALDAVCDQRDRLAAAIDSAVVGMRADLRGVA